MRVIQSEVDKDDIVQVSADGAKYQYKCDEKASQLGAKATIPPGKDGVIWEHGNVKKLLILGMIT